MRLFRALFLSAFSLAFVVALSSCGGVGSTASSTTATTTTTNAYAAAYQSAKYNNGSTGTMTVAFPSSCSMTVTGTGVPYTHQVYYLGPAANGSTVVATTPSGVQLGVNAYSGGLSNVKAITATFNICPTKAGSTTATTGGAIGLIFSGTALFDPYEQTNTVALADNVSYTFASTACGGTTCTASFLDSCNQHATNGGGMTTTSTWHYHGNPNCWTSVVDGASNGASHIIGIALDGYPIYGGRDVNGNVVAVSSLDACNGITSATPEFPSGAYHYVLPIASSGAAITTAQSSIGCYAGTVSATLTAQMKALACKMPVLLADGNVRLPNGTEVSRPAAKAWLQRNGMGTMTRSGM